MPFDPNQPFDNLDKFDSNQAFEEIEPTDDGEDTLGKITDFVHRQAKGAISGLNQLIPFSDQIVAASVTARQMLSGEISEDQLLEQYRNNVTGAIKAKKEAVKEAPVAAGVGMGLGAVGQAVATGGASIPAQAALATGQSAGIVGGEALAEGKSGIEAATEAAYGGLTAAALSGLPEAAKLAKKGGKAAINKLKDIIKYQGSGLSQEEKFGRGALKVLGASKQQSVDLLDDAPDIAKTLKDQNILKSGFEQKSLIWKRANQKKTEIGKEVKKVYSRLKERISNEEVHKRIMLKADKLRKQAPKANDAKIKALEKHAAKFRDDKSVTANQLWEERKAIDSQIYNTNRAISKTGTGTTKKEVLSDVRNSIQDSINDKIVGKYGKEALENLQGLNRDFGNLSTINKLAKSNQFSSKAGFIDKITVGSGIAAAHSPVVGGALLVGRPALQYFGPRAKFTPKIKLGGGPSKQALVAPTAKTIFDKLK